MKRAVQIILMLLVGGTCLWLAFKDVEFAAFKDELSQVNWWIYGSGVFMFFMLHVTRSIRWGKLVQAVEPTVTFRSYFSICSVGFFLINVLPFRLGEFVRPYLLFEREEVPFGSGMATVLLERVLDVMALGALFVGVLLFADIPSTVVTVAGSDYDIVRLGRTTILGALIPFGGAALALVAMGDKGVEIARTSLGRVDPRVGELAATFLATFVSTLKSLGDPKHALSVLAWTAVPWTVNVLSMLWMAKAFSFGAGLGFWDGAAILVAVCIGLILPAPPGFAGVFELAITIGVALYGVGAAPAAAFAVCVHAGQFILLTSLGTLFLVLDKISVRRLLDSMAELRTQPT
jgi:glycosyltransferase 2 family protein